MDYYKKKIEAIKLIDELIKKNEFTADQIALAVLKEYAFGDKFVNNYLSKLLRLKKIVIHEKTGVISEDE